MKPHQAIRQLLVKPKDRREKEEKAEVVYKIACKNCEKTYVGETGRKLGTRISEHRKDVDDPKHQSRFTRTARKESLTERHKSALTDHAMRENHVIDWDNIKIVEKESDRKTRHIKEAIAIREQGPTSLNRDEGQHPLSHIFYPFLEFPVMTSGPRAVKSKH